MAWINGVWYDDNGMTSQAPTPEGIGGAPSGRAPWYGTYQSPNVAHTVTPQSPLVRGGNQARAAQIGAARRGWNYQPRQGTPSSLPAGYDPNAPLGAIGGVQNDTSAIPGTPYPMNPFQTSNNSANGFSAGGNQFTRGSLNPDGTINWSRSDGASLNPMNQQEFSKFFGNDLASYYYGTGSQGNGSPYPMSPYGDSGFSGNVFTSEGQQFNITGRVEGMTFRTHTALLGGF